MKRTTIVPISKKRRAALPERKAVRAAALERDGGCRFWAHAIDLPRDIRDALPLACEGDYEANEIIRHSQWKAGWLVLENIVILCARHHRFVTENSDIACMCGLQKKSWERPDLLSPGEGE